jgi:RHS repeat-associated protein
MDAVILMKRGRTLICILLMGKAILWMEPVNGQIQTSRFVYHTDGLGSVVAMTDSSQQTAKSYAYEAFGKIRSETGTLTIDRYTYTAREALGDSLGLYYYRWRVMDPNVGRFTSEDPLDFVDGANLYLYVKNNPSNFKDPAGLVGCGKPKCQRTCQRTWNCSLTGKTLVFPGKYTKIWLCFYSCVLASQSGKCPPGSPGSLVTSHSENQPWDCVDPMVWTENL